MSEAARIFNDSLAMRAKQLRFRGVGNPYAFLEGIGLAPIKEFIYRGATLIDLAETLNLPVATVRSWIHENGFDGEIEEAAVVSAEGYLSKGQNLLTEAKDSFELRKAKLILEHARFMASKKDKKGYGGTQKDLEGPAAVMYQFNITQAEPHPDDKPIEPRLVNPESVTLEHDQPRPDVQFNLDILGPPPRHARDPRNIPKTNVVPLDTDTDADTQPEEAEKDTRTNRPQDRWNI